MITLCFRDQERRRIYLTGKSYKASGKYTFVGVLLVLIGGLAGCFLLGAAYTYLLGLLSNMALRFLVIFGYLAALSGWLILLVRKARIRNTRVVLLLSIIILLATYYSNWVLYVHLVYDSWQKGANEVWAYHFQFPLLLQRWWELLISPAALLNAITEIIPIGFNSINSQIIKGIPLLIIWITEFLLVFFIPLYHVVYRAGRPYDEDRRTWLPTIEEWTVSYLEDYREIRNELRRGNAQELLNALENLQFYQLQGQESYAIIEFYRKRKHIGPYITITNVKAVQTGPRKLVHRAIVVAKMVDVGEQAAQETYQRVRKGYETYGRESRQPLSDKVSNATFNLSRRTKNITSECKNNTKSKKHRAQRLDQAVQPEVSNTEELPASIEEITVHVPKVTPEMEKEYLRRKQK